MLKTKGYKLIANSYKLKAKYMSKVLDDFIKTEYMSRQVPDFRVGDIVKVHQIVPDIKAQKKVSKTAKAIKKAQADDGAKTATRIQVFEGVVIAKKHGREPGASFTVRKIAVNNIGVEKIFPLYSPLVKKIEVVSRPTKVRRAKLYFLRDRVGKKARRLSVGVAVEQERTSVEEAPSNESSDASTDNVESTESRPESVGKDQPKADQPRAGEPKIEEEPKKAEAKKE